MTVCTVIVNATNVPGLFLYGVCAERAGSGALEEREVPQQPLAGGEQPGGEPEQLPAPLLAVGVPVTRQLPKDLEKKI